MGPHSTLALRIKELRQLASFTQQDLSRASGLSRSYISRLEMGDIALPSRDKLRALAGALHASLDDLLRAAGFLDEDAGSSDLPDLKTYLRRRYAIHDPQALHALETIVEALQKNPSEPAEREGTA
ncbi:MAG: helix-turn-helix domain-containing protein [Chloroflexota bacterium]|nr:helix-turn-helix domain-containing protein [Chloroflexota bacterium]